MLLPFKSISKPKDSISGYIETSIFRALFSLAARKVEYAFSISLNGYSEMR